MPLRGIHCMSFDIAERRRLSAGVPYHSDFARAQAVSVSNGIAGAFLVSRNWMIIRIIFIQILGNIFIRVINSVPLRIFILIRIVGL